MPRRKLDTIDREEFDRRLDASNERLRLELIEAEERLRKMEMVVVRKEVLLERLEQTLAEIEREEQEIAALEKEISVRRPMRARQSPSSTGL